MPDRIKWTRYQLTQLQLLSEGMHMKSLFKPLLLALGIASLAGISSVVFASPDAPEMDGTLVGQVSLLIAGVYLVAKASSKKK